MSKAFLFILLLIVAGILILAIQAHADDFNCTPTPSPTCAPTPTVTPIPSVTPQPTVYNAPTATSVPQVTTSGVAGNSAVQVPQAVPNTGHALY